MQELPDTVYTQANVYVYALCSGRRRVLGIADGNWIKDIVCRSSHPPRFILSHATERLENER